jgi:alpha-glucosidase (family GH31 glycosyl hydrolase)
LFVRDGGIIPLLTEERRQVPSLDEHLDLEVRHYGEADGNFELYDDDGATFAHERGHFSWATLAVRRDASGTLRGEVRRPPNGKPFSYRTIRWRMMTPR